MSAAVIALGVAVGLLALLVVGLLRSHAEILRQLNALTSGRPAGGRTPFGTRPGVALPPGLGAGAEAADLVGVDPSGDAVRVGVVGAGHATLALFVTSGCTTCRPFWDALADPASLGLRAGIRPVAVTKGPEEESPSAVAALASPGVTTVMSSDAWAHYEVSTAPYAVLIDGPSGRVVGEGAALTWEHVRDLMHQALDDAGARRRGGSTEARGEDVDAELRAAGIVPGDPRLFGGWDDAPAREEEHQP